MRNEKRRATYEYRRSPVACARAVFDSSDGRDLSSRRCVRVENPQGLDRDSNFCVLSERSGLYPGFRSRGSIRLGFHSDSNACTCSDSGLNATPDFDIY
ncbi:hypothetical protein EVAR_38425_1 [Eumeta japonica]|uniref:Uncharacterized protein n=1 Tax=Eumeta variegata TaxID=151549 RepID=A0A4C1WWL2_EUMVA|nr:hypothetical protein EVAR_38425_1 [Eumeta japonica]